MLFPFRFCRWYNGTDSTPVSKTPISNRTPVTMSDGKKQVFVWDDDALEVESIEIPFPKRGEKVTESTERVTFYELSQKDLFAFLKEATATKIIVETREPNPTFNSELPESEFNPREIVTQERKDYDTVYNEKTEVLYKYLAIATDGKKKVEWFKKLDLTYRMWGRLTDMLFELCHIEELQLSNGNPFILPQIQAERMGQILPTTQEETPQE